MPFAPITVTGGTFNAAGVGEYENSTTTFGSPSDRFKIRGGTLSKDKKLVTATVSRTYQRDVTTNGVTERKSAVVQLLIQVPTTGFTSSDLDAVTNDINQFVTAANLDRLLGGES